MHHPLGFVDQNKLVTEEDAFLEQQIFKRETSLQETIWTKKQFESKFRNFIKIVLMKS